MGLQSNTGALVHNSTTISEAATIVATAMTSDTYMAFIYISLLS